ncbi:hypothetical protein [Pseudomonas citronellolis]|uniref:hypothetical protein n=1 Tax=Pseudomonas citronellolis TaxID=53408 RepID=UPI0023E3BC62|nr:hypothetical protein [Pseudomonas citronellolis]MDF3932216.1 hypothetical protein [Pseudomonas citronellolis]
MPKRNATAIDVGAALASAFSRRGQTQSQVAAMYGVSQSRIGRIYAGDFTRRSHTAKQMCEDTGVKFLDAPADMDRYAHNRKRLIRLLDVVWKGTDEDAAYLADALIAIGRLRHSD